MVSDDTVSTEDRNEVFRRVVGSGASHDALTQAVTLCTALVRAERRATAAEEKLAKGGGVVTLGDLAGETCVPH